MVADPDEFIKIENHSNHHVIRKLTDPERVGEIWKHEGGHVLDAI